MPAHRTSVTAASSTSPPQSTPQSLTVPVARTKNGCWTCRLRKKACDGHFSANGDGATTCETCQRLHIQCLDGRGKKRAKALRAHVPSILASIKQHLEANGLNRRARRPPFPDPNRVIPILQLWHAGLETSDTEFSGSTSSGSSWDGSSPPPLTPTTKVCDTFDEGIEPENTLPGNMFQQHVLPQAGIYEYETGPTSNMFAHPMGRDEYPNVQPPSPEQANGANEYGSSYGADFNWPCYEDF